MKKLLAWIRQKLEEWVMKQFEKPPLKLLLTIPILIVAILPRADELVVPVTDTCLMNMAKTCKQEYISCRSVGLGADMPGAVRVRLVDACYNQYDKQCAGCGVPVDLKCRTYWERYRHMGPWWAGTFAMGKKLWEALFPPKPSRCEWLRRGITGA